LVDYEFNAVYQYIPVLWPVYRHHYINEIPYVIIIKLFKKIRVMQHSNAFQELLESINIKLGVTLQRSSTLVRLRKGEEWLLRQ
jgi:hypothetical protein